MLKWWDSMLQVAVLAKLWLAKHLHFSQKIRLLFVLISSPCPIARWCVATTLASNFNDLLIRGGCQFRSGWIAIALLKLVRHSSAWENFGSECCERIMIELKSTGQARVLAHPKYFMQADPGEGWRGRIIGEVVGDGEFTVKNPKKPGKVQSILVM